MSKQKGKLLRYKMISGNACKVWAKFGDETKMAYLTDIDLVKRAFSGDDTPCDPDDYECVDLQDAIDDVLWQVENESLM